jgi:hypothetical protein
VSAVAHLVVGFVFLVSGLVVPWYVVPGLVAWWVVLAVVGVRVARRRSRWVAAVPLVAAASWGIVLMVGEAAFDWTA